jgi:putative spermidine/putrescine transport system permease protein
MRAVDGRIWLILPAMSLLAVAFLVPVGWLLSRAFTFRAGLQNFALLWERPVYMRVMMNTLMISAIVTPVTSCCLPVAHLMAHGSDGCGAG